ncbi:hypothetical protein DPMN_032609 [Dreissena polymorpha]|uniref:Uncharacterized protein n=1 Tax=Dreissena polymorpha TaxID=45954 RepID=A0A9D4M5D1_DREPO|nr:hypothetical protein DPMN_032609 [Dreissena polymorpha]
MGSSEDALFNLGEHAEYRSFCTICFLAEWLKVATTHSMGDDIYQYSWRHSSTFVSCTCPSLSLPLNQLEIFPPPPTASRHSFTSTHLINLSERLTTQISCLVVEIESFFL